MSPTARSISTSRTKKILLIQLFEDRMDFIITRLNEELAISGTGADEQLRRMITMHLNLAVQQPDLAEFITVELRQSARFVREYENPRFVEYLRILRDIVERGQREGVVRAGLDSRLIVRAIFGALDEVLLTLTLASRQIRSVDVQLAANQLADLFLEGVG